MSETIVRVRWEPSSEGGSENFSLEELGVESFNEWESLDREDQRQRIQEAFDGRPEVVWATASKCEAIP